MTTLTLTTEAPRTPTVSPVAQLGRLAVTELRLLFRQPQTLVFVFGFPVLTVLILGEVFAGDVDPEFELVDPQHFYTAGYFGVVLTAIATIMLPVHIASYREGGILRRFDTSGFPRWAFPAAIFVNGVVFALLGFAALLLTAHVAFGLPTVDDPAGTAVGLTVATVAFVSLGVALGTLLPSARAAQGLGLTLFFPMFLLGGGGPPPESLDGVMRTISDWLPTSHAIRAVQEPWLDLGDVADHLVVLAALFVVSAAIWVRRSAAVGRAA